ANGQFVTAVFPANSTINFVDFRPTDGYSLPAGVSLPLGLFSFGIDGVTPNGPAIVELFVPGPLPASYYKIGPQPGNPAGGWYDWTYDAATGLGAEILADRVRLHFIDNQRGDASYSRDGSISDPGGPAVVVPQAPRVVSAQINDGAAQRSMVTSLTVTF